MASRVKGIVVEIGGDTTGLDKALKDTNKQINTTQSSLKDVERLLKLDPKNTTLLEQKQRLLSQAVSDTGDKLKVLQQAEKQVQEQFKKGEVSQDQYEALQREIVETRQKLGKLERDADDVASAIKGIDEKSLDDVADAADDAASAIKDIDEKPIRDVADAAEDAENALKEAGKQASGFGDHLKAELSADGFQAITDTLKDVAEESKEHRKIMASLDISSKRAGYSAEQTSEAYKKLYGILGDEQSAATTLANLQAIGLSQNELLGLIDTTVGAWAQYGDSIPIDGLAEAINETIKTGQVSGALADVLNWGTKENEQFGLSLKSTAAAEQAFANAEKNAKTLMEEYQVALKKAGGRETSYTQSLKARAEAAEENAACLEDQLNSLNEWNESVSNAASAEDKFNLALGECANEADRTNMIMQALAGQGLTSAGKAWQDTNQSLIESNQAQANMQEQMAQIGEMAEPIFTKITNAVSKALAWFNSLDSGTQTFILTVVGLIAVVAGVTPVVSSLITVFQGLGSVLGFIAANPIVLLIAAIVALVALIAVKGDEMQAILQKFDDFLQGIFAKDWTEVFGPVLGESINAFFATVKNVWDALRTWLNGIIDFIRGVFTGDWKRAWEGVKSIFTGIFSGYAAILKAPINGIIGNINSASGALNSLVQAANKLPGVDIPEITYRIPMLAEGGTVLRGSAIVGEAGPELLTVQPGRTIVQPLSSTTNNHNSTNLGNVSIAVYGAPGQDENQLAEIVMEKIQMIYASKEVALV